MYSDRGLSPGQTNQYIQGDPLAKILGLELPPASTETRYKRKQRAEARARGECVTCCSGRKPQPGYANCAECRRRNKIYQKRAYGLMLAAKAAGLEPLIR